MTTLREIFVTNVQARCERLGWNQSELGRQLGLSRARVNDVMRGKRNPTLETIESWAEALGVEPWKLLRP